MIVPLLLSPYAWDSMKYTLPQSWGSEGNIGERLRSGTSVRSDREFHILWASSESIIRHFIRPVGIFWWWLTVRMISNWTSWVFLATIDDMARFMNPIGISIPNLTHSDWWCWRFLARTRYDSVAQEFPMIFRTKVSW